MYLLNNENESLRDGCVECGFSHPRARYFIFARPKKSIQKKGRPQPRMPLRSSLLPGVA